MKRAAVATYAGAGALRRMPARLTQPWAITEEGLQLVLGVWSRGDFFADARIKALQLRDGEPLENAHKAYVRDGVAVIPVYGPLFRHASMFTNISGATSYSDLAFDLQAAIEDEDVGAILLDVNSPGGEADGVGELSDLIYAARDRKWTEAYVGGMGASAAYWLVSATQRITCAETAFLGSIGVRSAVIDDSERDKRDGVRTVEIISSQSPGKRESPVDDEVIAKAQRHVDDLAAVFISTVARNRGVTPEAVMKRFGRGDVVIGRKAQARGMVDAISDFETTVSDLAVLVAKGAA